MLPVPFGTRDDIKKDSIEETSDQGYSEEERFCSGGHTHSASFRLQAARPLNRQLFVVIHEKSLYRKRFMKAHIGVDADSNLVHHTALATAKVPDNMAGALYSFRNRI